MDKAISRIGSKHVTRKASGRKPTRKSDATRQQILDAAASLFAAKGYGLTRLADIAESADIHLTALYYYYDNKEELAADITGGVPARTLAALRGALDAMPTDAGPRARIEAAFSAYSETILYADDHARADHRIASQVSPEIRARATSVTRQINDIWRQLLDDAVAAGEIRNDLNLTLVRMLMLGSMNWALEWFKPEIGPPTRLADVLKTLFFEGRGTARPVAVGMARQGDRR